MRVITLKFTLISLLLSLLTALSVSSQAQAALPNLKQIATGFGHTCAIDFSESVYCWGNNEIGQMGNGTASAAEPGPVKLKDFSGVKSVSAGLAHTCIIDSKDDAYCWGQNDNGKLGYDSLEKSYTPVKVKDISNVSFIHAGRTASCLVSRGEVYCFGSNQLNELQTTSVEKFVLTPSKVPGLTSITKVIMGYQFACALSTTGELSCWGVQLNGRLGAVEENKPFPPSKMAINEPVKDFGVGAGHVCAVGNSGALYCWGWGERGQLGNSVTTATIAVPTKVASLPAVKEVVLNRFGTCALDTTNKVYCWGGGEFLQNGSSDKKDVAEPRLISGLGSVKSIGIASSYTSHVCVIDSNNEGKCWGYGFSMQLGNSVQGDSAVPIQIFKTSGSANPTESTPKNSVLDLVIECKKGKTTKVVSGISPKCPSGFSEVLKKKPKSTFYLDLKKGCYSANFPVSSLISVQGRKDYKTLYEAKCTSPYHFQVIYSGKVATTNNSPLPTQEQMGKHCQAEYKKVLGKETPTTIIGGGIYLAWYFPDAGIEASKYPQKGICYIWKWDSKRIYGDAAYAQVVTSALARN